jgi:hypothetical protein
MVVMGIIFSSIMVRGQIGSATVEMDVHYHFIYLQFSKGWSFGLSVHLISRG